jgi:anti-anti-sigma regulatory factor
LMLPGPATPGLREYLLRLTDGSAGRLMIEMSAVTDADRHGFTVLIGTRRRADLLGGLLGVAGTPAGVGRMLILTGLHRQLRTCPSVDSGICAGALANES